MTLIGLSELHVRLKIKKPIQLTEWARNYILIRAIEIFNSALRYKVPRLPCSLSIASNKALKFPLPKLLAPLR